MKIAVIRPRSKAVEIVADLDEALRLARLKPTRIEHRAVSARLTIMVYEYALFVSPDAQSYFRIGDKLYGGNAVLYAHDNGVGRDLTVLPMFNWFNNRVHAWSSWRR
jgi:hypothetical protein